MAKKVKERELDEDVLEQEAGKEGSVEDFITENRNLLLVVAAIVVLLVGGYSFYRYSQRAKNGEAQEEMFQAVYFFEQDSLAMSLRGDGQYLGFEDIVDEYKGTDAANLATYYIGMIYLKQGDLDTGIDYLKKFRTGDNMLSMAAYMALGFAHEDLGDPIKAASYFEQAAKTPGENAQTTPTMLLNAARNYETAGEPAKARKLYEQIKADYPTSSEGISIDKYLGRVAP